MMETDYEAEIRGRRREVIGGLRRVANFLEDHDELVLTFGAPAVQVHNPDPVVFLAGAGPDDVEAVSDAGVKAGTEHVHRRFDGVDLVAVMPSGWLFEALDAQRAEGVSA